MVLGNDKFNFASSSINSVVKTQAEYNRQLFRVVNIAIV